MPYLTTNGIRLSYQRSGSGEPVLLIMGSSAAGHVWTLHQTPALHKAGYENLEQIKWAILEDDGKIALIPADGERMPQTHDEDSDPA